MLEIDWARFHRDFPVTLFLGILNISLFLLAKLSIIDPLVSVPGVLNIGTFGAHFFHFGLIHLGSNLLILLLVGRVLEPRFGWRLLPITIFIWLLTIGILWVFNNVPVLGFSGITMGLLTFAMLEYKDDPYWYQLLWPMVIINILFGLTPGVSWWGHLGGAVAGLGIYYLWRIPKIAQSKKY